MSIKNNKGITLIALVITIIVLLVLAGVTISMVLGDDGIIQNAQEAKKQSENAEGKDAGAISQAEGVLSRYNISKYDDVKDNKNIAKQNSTITGEKASSSNPVIPKGFKHIDGTVVDTGFVIQDEVGNEFVWVPVKNMDDFKLDSRFEAWTGHNGTEPATVTGYPWEGGEGADKNPVNMKAILEDGYENSIAGLTKQFKDEYDAMVASVKAYGGFYVGRYETGWDDTNKVVVSKAGVPMTGATDLASVGWKCIEVNVPDTIETETTKATWYGLYDKQKELYKKNSSSSVVSGMIYGCQWDAIMNWMSASTNREVRDFVTDSRNKGNYNGPTGDTGTEGYDVNNIFDLAGNNAEWTQEEYGNVCRVDRGGNGYDRGEYSPASHREIYGYPTTAHDYLSSRLQLYIK